MSSDSGGDLYHRIFEVCIMFSVRAWKTELPPRLNVHGYIENSNKTLMEAKRSINEVISAGKPVLIDFFTTKCEPCDRVKPVVEQLGSLDTDTMVIGINVDKNPGVAQAYHVEVVPTLILFQQGEILWRQAGFTGADQLTSVVRRLLAKEKLGV